jgi:hypothetical protein
MRLAAALGAPEASVFFVFNGSGANVLSMRAALRPWEAAIVSANAHMETDEVGAPEAVAGVKLLVAETVDGRVTLEGVRRLVERPNDEHAVDIGDGVTEPLCHGVGVRGVLQPELVVQQSVELGGDEAHLRGQLQRLLAQVQHPLAQRGLEDHNRLTPQETVLGASEGEQVDATHDLVEADAQRNTRVGDPGAVDVHKQTAGMSKINQRAQLLERVQRPKLSRLGQRDQAGLDEVLVIGLFDQPLQPIQSQLPVDGLPQQQLETTDPLRRADLIGVQVRVA